VIGGQTEPVSAQLRESYQDGMELAEAVAVAVRGLQSAATGTASPAAATNGGAEDRLLGASALEVAVLDRNRPRRAFRRITGAALRALLPEENQRVDKAGEKAADAAEDESNASGDTPGASGSGTPSASS
jgi:proteasome alpha subunit